MYEVLNQKDKVFCRIGDEFTYMIFPNAADGVTIRIQKRENWYDDKDWNGGTVSAPVTMEEYESLTVHELNVIFKALAEFTVYLTDSNDKLKMDVCITEDRIRLEYPELMAGLSYIRTEESRKERQSCGR